MFDHIMNKPLTEESFTFIKNKLKKIYDHIIKNAKYYEDCDENAVKGLFISLKAKIEVGFNDEHIMRLYTPEVVDEIKSYLDSKVIDENEAKERLNDVLNTFSYAVGCFIEEVMTNYFYIRRDLNVGTEVNIEDDNYLKMFGAEHAITDLAEILFGYGFNLTGKKE